jgi:hypothetical protein
LLLLLTATSRSHAATTRPAEDPHVVLHNPDMGWVVYENYPVDPDEHGSSNMITLPKENFDGIDNVAIMFTWADVETRPGEYDFAAVDRAYDFWKKRGKRIQLRMSTESLLWWNTGNPPRGVGVPRHVLDVLPAAGKQTRQLQGINYVVVDARENGYLRALDKFLAAVASHFRGDRAVTLIDLRGFGVWGEWHSGFHYATLGDRRAALIGIIDHFSAAFPGDYLALSCSHDPDGPPDYYAGPADHFDGAFARNYNDFLHFSAFDYAMHTPNVTFRRDGVGSAVYSNERKLLDEAFMTTNRGPINCEFIQSYAEAKAAEKTWLKSLVDDALTMHPNYINLLGYQGADALAFMREHPALVARGMRRMGYRLVPMSITFPDAISAGKKFPVESTWQNRGVGRAMRDFHLLLLLADDNGKPIATADTGASGCDKWIGDRSYDVAKEVMFDHVPPGRYRLRIALEDPADHRRIALPLRGCNADESFDIGTIEITR